MAALLEEQREGVLDVNAVGRSRRETALHLSCDRNWLRLVVMLLDKGADVNKEDKFHRTPLYWTHRKGNLELARLLLSRGAKDNDTAQSSQKIVQKATPWGNPQLAAWLTARVGWHPMQYSCEVGWHLWSPSTHQYFSSTFRRGVVAMLLVDRRLKHQVGKDVLYHLLSYCGWDWFEVVVVGDEEGRRPN